MKNKTIITVSLLFCFTFCFAMTAADLTGKWTGKAEGSDGPVDIYFTFKVTGQTLTGSVEGPQGTVDLENGTYKDSVLAYDIDVNGAGKMLHQMGKYYGDSVTLDFTVRSGPIHLKLLRSK